MATKETLRVEHKPNWFIHVKYGLLIVSIVIGWGIREAKRIAPKVNQAVSKIAQGEKVDLTGTIGGCTAVRLKGVI